MGGCGYGRGIEAVWVGVIVGLVWVWGGGEKYVDVGMCGRGRYMRV